MKTIQRIGVCALALALAACKPATEATPGTPRAATTAPEALPVDATSVIDNSPSVGSTGDALDTKALAGKFGDGESVLELRADGSYVQTLQAGGNAIAVDGSWSALEGSSLLLDPSSKSAEDVRFQVVSNDELRGADGTRTFRRVASQ